MPLHEISSAPENVLSYVEFTSSVTVSATVEATPNDVVAASALSFNGTTVARIEFYSPQVDCGGTAGSWVLLNLWDGASEIGRLANVTHASGTQPFGVPVYAIRYLTPTNASHTYSIKAWRINANGTVAAGPGGSGLTMPGFIRVSRA